MADNIPRSYYFLFRINKTIMELSFLNFIDLGYGSGRIFEFFNKNFPNKHLIGIECHKSQYDADCFFLDAPFKKDCDFIKFMKSSTALSFNKKILLIIVNYNKKIVEEFKNIKFIETYYISNNKGYSICCLDNN